MQYYLWLVLAAVTSTGTFTRALENITMTTIEKLLIVYLTVVLAASGLIALIAVKLLGTALNVAGTVL